MEVNNLSRDGKIVGLRKGLSELQNCKTKGDIYTTTIQLMSRTFDFDFCVLLLRSQNTLIVKRKGNGKKPEDPDPYRIGKNLSTLTLNRAEVIWDDDFVENSQVISLPDGIDSFVSVPVDDIGTLQVFAREEGVFSAEDVNLMGILANHLRERITRVELEEDLREQAIHDQLTGLYNRRYLKETLAKETQRARRYGHSLSFLMLDINEFKEVNDYYSHVRGDKVLKEIGKVLEENVREADTVIRYGGDEFLILLPETGEGSRTVKSRIQEEIENWNRESDLVDFPLTVALGASSFDPDEEIDIEEKITEADSNMYKNKQEQG